MKTIKIADGITATLTNKTYNAMTEYKAESEKLNRWKQSALEDRDYGDYMYYDHLEDELEDKFAWLWN